MWAVEAARMVRPYSLDLRERLVSGGGGTTLPGRGQDVRRECIERG
jgi:hypothetical protein